MTLRLLFNKQFWRELGHGLFPYSTARRKPDRLSAGIDFHKRSVWFELKKLAAPFDAVAHEGTEPDGGLKHIFHSHHPNPGVIGPRTSKPPLKKRCCDR